MSSTAAEALASSVSPAHPAGGVSASASEGGAAQGAGAQQPGSFLHPASQHDVANRLLHSFSEASDSCRFVADEAVMGALLGQAFVESLPNSSPLTVPLPLFEYIFSMEPVPFSGAMEAVARPIAPIYAPGTYLGQVESTEEGPCVLGRFVTDPFRGSYAAPLRIDDATDICTAITTWDTRKVSAVVSAEDPSAVFVLRCRVKVAPDVVSPAISAVLEAAGGADAEHPSVHEGAALDAFRQAYGIEHFSVLKPVPFIDFHGALIQLSGGEFQGWYQEDGDTAMDVFSFVIDTLSGMFLSCIEQTTCALGLINHIQAGRSESEAGLQRAYANELEHCVHTIVGAVRTSRMLRLQAVCEQLLGMIQQLTVDVPHEPSARIHRMKAFVSDWTFSMLIRAMCCELFAFAQFVEEGGWATLVPQALASAEVLEGLQKITTEAVLRSIAGPYNVCYGDFEPGRLAQRDFSQ